MFSHSTNVWSSPSTVSLTHCEPWPPVGLIANQKIATMQVNQCFSSSFVWCFAFVLLFLSGWCIVLAHNVHTRFVLVFHWLKMLPIGSCVTLVPFCCTVCWVLHTQTWRAFCFSWFLTFFSFLSSNLSSIQSQTLSSKWFVWPHRKVSLQSWMHLLFVSTGHEQPYLANVLCWCRVYAPHPKKKKGKKKEKRRKKERKKKEEKKKKKERSNNTFVVLKY